MPDQDGAISRKRTNLRFAVYAAKGSATRVPQEKWEFCANDHNPSDDNQQGWLWNKLGRELTVWGTADDTWTILAFVAAGHGGDCCRATSRIPMIGLNWFLMMFRIRSANPSGWMFIPICAGPPREGMVMDALTKVTESIPVKYRS